LPSLSLPLDLPLFFRRRRGLYDTSFELVDSGPFLVPSSVPSLLSPTDRTLRGPMTTPREDQDRPKAPLSTPDGVELREFVGARAPGVTSKELLPFIEERFDQSSPSHSSLCLLSRL